MRIARIAVAGVVCLCVAAVVAPSVPAGAPQPAPEPAELSRYLPAAASSAIEVLRARVDERAAMDLVVFMDRYWRNAANEGFNASLDRIKDRLEASGFAARAAGPADGPSLWVEAFGRANGWNHSVGTLTLAADGETPDEVLLSRERHRVALCMNSFSTPPGGLVAPIVDVGPGAAAADYEGRDVGGGGFSGGGFGGGGGGGF